MPCAGRPASRLTAPPEASKIAPVTIGDLLGTLASPALGIFIGWFLLKSRFNFDRVFRWPVARGNRQWLYAWLFGIAISWFVMGIAYLDRLCEVQRLPDCGPLASVLGGILAGLAVGMLGKCPLWLVLGSGMTSLWALIALGAWMAGLVVGQHSSLVIPFARIQEVGLLDFGWQGLNDYIGIPRWIVLMVAGLGLGAWMIRLPVSVRPGWLEWPKQGVAIGFIVVVGWLLALAGGNFGGMNLVEAVDDVWTGLTGGSLWIRPALLMAVGLAGWGFITMLRTGKLFSDPVGDHVEIVVLLGASFLLGIACALAKGDPVAHCLFGAGVLQASSLLFTGGMWGGAVLFGRIGRMFERKGGG